MPVKDEVLEKSLRDLQIVDPEKLDSLVDESKSKKISLSELLLSEDLISDENLGKIYAEILEVPFVKLSEESVKDEVLQIVPEVVAKKQNIISFKKDKNGLHLATSDPGNKLMKEFLEKKIGMPVIFYYATPRSLEDTMTLYTKDIKDVFKDIIQESVKSAKGKDTKDPSIVKIVDATIEYAYQNKASDIHIEPFEEESIIRFRIDGVLHDIVGIPIDLHAQVITRIKVLAKLRTDEHQVPQDGKIKIKIRNEMVDLRVSIVPVTHDEKAVMRILSDKSRNFSLPDLGLVGSDLEKLKEAYNKPHGMILATGPTGSGKTTTLYSVLKLLNKRTVNIMTIEDPVEYDIEGVNQIQVNEKTGLTFGGGLRSIVRQDPDVLLVGEIRDQETADISVNAAMTGHLVLSSVHTNNAATTIPRLLDLGVEPFLIASTVNVIIGQRLVRKICTKCRFSKEVDINKKNSLDEDIYLPLFKKYFSGSEKIRVYEGKGCEVCHHTGYIGRVGIFEIMLIDEDLRKAITGRSDANEIQKIAVKNGMTTMLEDGIHKVKDGITTVSEVLRVTKE